MRTPTNQLKFGVILLIVAIAVFSGVNTQAQRTGAPRLGAATANVGARAFGLCPAINDTTGSVVTAQAGVTASPAATPSSSGGPGYLGAQVVAADSCGVLVLGTLPDSPAAGQIMTGDVIVAIDCVPLTSTAVFDSATSVVPAAGTPNAAPANCSSAQTAPGKEGTATDASNIEGATILSAFFSIIELHQAGDQILLTLDRNNQEMNITVTLSGIPEGEMPFAATSASTQASSGSAAGSGAGGSASGSGAGGSPVPPPTTAPLTSPTASGSGAAGSASGSGGSSAAQPTTAPLAVPTTAGSGVGGGSGGSVPSPIPQPTTVPVVPPTSVPSPVLPPTTVPSPTSAASRTPTGH